MQIPTHSLPVVDNSLTIRSTRLPNGILVISETMPGVESVAFGLWTDAGSVEESPDEEGVAHFLEHMLFKGTATRSAFMLAEEIEDVGGHLNAFTERETTHLYAHILAEHLPVAVNLLADMLCHSTFPAEEIERERQVVIEEIRRYESLPEERIHDLIMEGLWQDGGLGHPILGTEESIQALTRERVIDCWQRQFAAERVLVTAAGKIDHDCLVAQVAAAFADLPALREDRPVIQAGTQIPSVLVEADEEQVNFCWGGRSYPAGDERNFALAMLDGAFGGSTTSRLFQEIREKRGLAYDVTSYSLGFRNSGLFCANVATSPEAFLEVVELVRREVTDLRAHGMTTKEFTRAKEQLKASMALSQESTLERMSRLANHQLTWGAIYPLQYLIHRVNAVTPEDVQQVIDEIFDLAKWTFTAIGPFDPTAVKALLKV